MTRRFSAVHAVAAVIACLCVAAPAGSMPVAAAPRLAGHARPAVIGRMVLGRSVDGREIIAYHLGTPGAKTRAVVLGQMHGDEHAGIAVVRALRDGRPIKGIDLWVIPTINPDGNAANMRANAHGVDLNRNWPHTWVRDRTRCYTGPDGLERATGCNSGPRPLSEPESQAMHRFLKWFRPTLMVSIHQPLDGVDKTDGGQRDPAFRDRLARFLHLPLKSFRCFSTCHGSMTGWITAHQSGSAITVEFGDDPSRHDLTRTAPRAILAAFGARYVAS